jgi:phosphate-selective porin OprO/OprP
VPAVPSFAEDAARIEALENALLKLQSSTERQIHALQEELRQMRREVAKKDAELRAREQPARAHAEAHRAPPESVVAHVPAVATQSLAATAPATAPSPAQPVPEPTGWQVKLPGGRPTISDGRYTFAVGLQLQYDVGGYFNDHRPNNPQVPTLINFGENLRRGRIPFVFTAALSKEEDLRANITPEFGGSPDGTPTLYEANINYVNRMLGVPVTATLGYFKPWLTLQDSMSSNDFLFLERPSIVEIARRLAAGDARASLGVQANGNQWFAAGYLTGQTYGQQSATLSTVSQTGATLRVAGRPYTDRDMDVHLGFSTSGVFHVTRNAQGQTLQLADRPELRIDQNQLINTGALAADSAWEYGPEFAFRWRNLVLQGEFIQIGINRTSTPQAYRPNLSFLGGYVEGSWVITGEPHPYIPAEGAFGRPHPKHPFSLAEGHWGAFELAARYSVTDLNNRVFLGIPAVRTGGVYGGRQQVISFGANWYPIDQFRFMLDYDIIDVDRLDAAGAAQIGQRVQAIGFRGQAAF